MPDDNFEARALCVRASPVQQSCWQPIEQQRWRGEEASVLPKFGKRDVGAASLGCFCALRHPATRVDVRLLELTVTCRAQLPGRNLPVMVLVTKESGWHSLLDPGKMHPPSVCKVPRVQGATAAGGES